MVVFANLVYISEDATPVKDSCAIVAAEEFINECRTKTKTGQTLYICQDLMLLALREAMGRLQMADADLIGIQVEGSTVVWALNPRMPAGFWIDLENYAYALTTSDRLLSLLCGL